MEQNSYLADEELLQAYLTMPKEQREVRFADTARAAELIDRSQRTIQYWIEIGAIQAVAIGSKYKVDLDSLKEYLKKLRADRRFNG